MECMELFKKWNAWNYFIWFNKELSLRACLFDRMSIRLDYVPREPHIRCFVKDFSGQIKNTSDSISHTGI